MNMKSLIFRFPMTYDQSKALLEQSKCDEEFFRTIIGLSIQLKQFVNEDDIQSLTNFFNQNVGMIPFLRIFIDESFEQAVLYRYEEIIRYFINNSYQVTDKKILITLLQTSRFLKHDPPIEVLELLLKEGNVKPDEGTDDKFRTPLHLACKYGIKDFIKILIENGADINAIDKKKFTPLMYLQKKMQKEEGLDVIEKYMYQKGAETYVTSIF
ncbi:unnamed protein product [Paramecium sonneborni]|uniref:Ankyrin repeat protein n=1 Tax=Paramecium sonneborni TaxID=65129 RepID=A0A8S1KWG8_9CILI|nr:unnamed protein product [Paramecium sonneborni]